MIKRKTKLLLSMMAAGMASSSVFAEGLMLEEIVVTAQKREQTLQEVPVAVSVIDDGFVQREHILGLEGLGDKVPNLTVSKTPFQPTVNIRGMGTGGGTRAFEQSVAMYVDGVYAGRANQFLNPFFDVERVEVVRGPQTVLFGVNAIAGGINIVNKAPAPELEGFVSSSYELENETYYVDGAVSIPLTEDLAIRLSGRKGIDGQYIEDRQLGIDGNGNPVDRIVDGPEIDFDLFRAVAVWNASDDVTVKFSAEASSNDTDGSAQQMYALSAFGQAMAGSVPGSNETGNLDFQREVAYGSDEFTYLDSENYVLNVEWSVGEHTLTSVTGYSQYDFDQAVSAGAVPVNLGSSMGQEEYDQTYQEFRITSPGGETLDYVAGLVYLNQNSDIYQGVDVSFGPGAEGGVRNTLNQETNAYAVFGQVTYSITDSVRAVLGLRYSDVEKEADYLLTSVAVGTSLQASAADYNYDAMAFLGLGLTAGDWFQWFNPVDMASNQSTVFQRKRTLSQVDPSLSIQWDVNDTTGAYFTVSKGTKAGGFNDQDKQGVIPENGYSDDMFEYDDEEATNYEVGVKFDEGRWRANAAVFYTKFDNLQVSQSVGNSIVTGNAATVVSQGLELDGIYLLTENIEVGGNLALLDSTYDSFDGVVCPYDEAFITMTCVQGDNNVDGEQTELAAEITSNMYVQWRGDVSDNLELTLKVDAYYNDGYSLAADQDPIDVVDSYWKYGMLVELASLDGQWSVSLNGKNLTDEVILAQGGDAGLDLGHAGFVLPGRQVFLSGRWNF